jgi:hypothetical protein
VHIVEGLPGERPGARSRLFPAAMAACIQGKQGLLAEQYLVRWLDGERYPSPGCHLGAENMCAAPRLKIMMNLQPRLAEMHARMMWNRHDGLDWDAELCEACAKVGREAFESSMAALWRDFPVFFGLPGWDRLLEDMETCKSDQTALGVMEFNAVVFQDAQKSGYAVPAELHSCRCLKHVVAPHCGRRSTPRYPRALHD